MRRLIIVFLVLTAGHVKAQSPDTIVFADGLILHAFIKSLPGEDDTLHYSYRGKDKSVYIMNVYQYSFDGKWYDQNAKGKFTERDYPKHQVRRNFWRDGKKWGNSRFSLGINLTSFWFEKDVNEVSHGYYYNIRDVNDHLFSTNRMISIEPEYLVNDWLSVKMPIWIGIPQKTTDVTNDFVGEGYYGNATIGQYYRPNYFEEGHFNVGFISNNPGNYYYYALMSDEGHARSMIFQVGGTPKFFPFGQRKQSLYLAPSVNVGMMDYLANTYYVAYDTTWEYNYNNESETGWELISESVEREHSQTLFFRWEALIGVNLNCGKNFAFAVEAGYSSKIHYATGPEDWLMLSLNGAPFQQIDVRNYEDRSSNMGYVVSRAHLIIKFGGEPVNSIKRE